MESAKTAKKNKNLPMGSLNHCHDCRKKIETENKELKDAFLLEYENEDGGEKISVLKCSRCFEKNPSLTDFQKCEVYSRVCGYLRPVRQWNEGKRREFKERKEYKIKTK